MEQANFLEHLATRLGQSATVKNVFGEPVTVDGKTIIPVAQIAYGFGGGQGRKGSGLVPQPTNGKEEGSGGGGGIMARPKGVYEITASGTRFIPAGNTALLVVAALAGFLIRGWIKK